MLHNASGQYLVGIAERDASHRNGLHKREAHIPRGKYLVSNHASSGDLMRRRSAPFNSRLVLIGLYSWLPNPIQLTSMLWTGFYLVCPWTQKHEKQEHSKKRARCWHIVFGSYKYDLCGLYVMYGIYGLYKYGMNVFTTLISTSFHRPVMLCANCGLHYWLLRFIHSLQCVSFVKYLDLSGCKYILKQHTLFLSFLKP